MSFARSFQRNRSQVAGKTPPPEVNGDRHRGREPRTQKPTLPTETI